MSLHAPDSETRSKIMPINRAYDVEELFAAWEAAMEEQEQYEQVQAGENE